MVSERYHKGSRTIPPQDISAPRRFGANFKPNHRWSCVSSELSWVQSVPTFRRSEAEVSRQKHELFSSLNLRQARNSFVHFMF